MTFHKIDLDTWPRREYFEHYFRAVPCTYSAVFRLDVTALRQSGRKFYPSMLHHLSAAVNRRTEFRMTCLPDGTIGYYDLVHPCFTIFHKDTETFSNLWTPYVPDRDAFLASFDRVMTEWGNRPGLTPQPDVPENTFPVSTLPWASFEGFNLNLQHGYTYLPPIFTMGKFAESGGRMTLPLAVQAHHAVCDGFHVCRLIGDLQELLDAES